MGRLSRMRWWPCGRPPTGCTSVQSRPEALTRISCFFLSAMCSFRSTLKKLRHQGRQAPRLANAKGGHHDETPGTALAHRINDVTCANLAYISNRRARRAKQHRNRVLRNSQANDDGVGALHRGLDISEVHRVTCQGRHAGVAKLRPGSASRTSSARGLAKAHSESSSPTLTIAVAPLRMSERCPLSKRPLCKRPPGSRMTCQRATMPADAARSA